MSTPRAVSGMGEVEVREITNRGAWLNWRARDITASRIAALFDAHPFMSRDQLAADLRQRAERFDSPAMRRGRILEPAVIASLAEDYPDWQMTKATTYHRLADHRLGATPDYWLGDDGLIQVKTVSPEEWEKWQGHPPLAYTLQTLVELMVTGRPYGRLAVMVVSRSFPVHLFDVPRHPNAERRILSAVAAWWTDWEAGKVAGAAGADEIACEVDDGTHADLSADNSLPALLDEREGLKAAESTATRRLKEIDAAVKEKIGAARTAWLPGWTLTYATQHRRETMVPASDFRVLRVKRTAED